MKNERTSKRVAKIAGKILAQKIPGRTGVEIAFHNKHSVVESIFLSGSDINALAASALTQTPDKSLKNKAKRHAKRW